MTLSSKSLRPTPRMVGQSPTPSTPPPASSPTASPSQASRPAFSPRLGDLPPAVMWRERDKELDKQRDKGQGPWGP